MLWDRKWEEPFPLAYFPREGVSLPQRQPGISATHQAKAVWEVLKKYPCHLWGFYASVMGFLAELWDLRFSIWVPFFNFTLCMMLKKHRHYLSSDTGEVQTFWDSRLNSLLQVLRLQLKWFIEKTFHITVMFERIKIKWKRNTFSEKLFQHSPKFHGFPGKRFLSSNLFFDQGFNQI